MHLAFYELLLMLAVDGFRFFFFNTCHTFLQNQYFEKFVLTNLEDIYSLTFINQSRNNKTHIYENNVFD